MGAVRVRVQYLSTTLGRCLSLVGGVNGGSRALVSCCLLLLLSLSCKLNTSPTGLCVPDELDVRCVDE